MTPEQYEAAALELCRRRGQDPHKVREDFSGRLDPDPHLPRYIDAALAEIRRFSEVGTAIAHALGTTPEQEPLARTSAME